jgi:hypothetical protein
MLLPRFDLIGNNRGDDHLLLFRSPTAAIPAKAGSTTSGSFSIYGEASKMFLNKKGRPHYAAAPFSS